MYIFLFVCIRMVIRERKWIWGYHVHIILHVMYLRILMHCIIILEELS